MPSANQNINFLRHQLVKRSKNIVETLKSVSVALAFMCFYVLVAYTSAQCPGAPRRPNCLGGRNPGRGGRGCNQRTMWYWNGRSCEAFNYLGCGGNNNRWCSQAACNQRCRR
ncbi:hypothetical protein DOY81_011569 [Sarcophaga bullata]|nr:hypothetical protein DOY81_011569 [Sarcophaga bullata]